MSYEDRDTYGMYKRSSGGGPGPTLMGADTLIGNDVYNHKDEDLGDIKEIMLDARNGWVTMITTLSVLILAATLLAGCYPFASYPRQQTTTTTTTTCPAGTRLQSDGMCR